MSNRDLDRMLRERLENYEMVPPMHVWENIAQARARRPISPWVWWTGGAGVLAVSGAIVLWLALGQTSLTPPSAPDSNLEKAVLASALVDEESLCDLLFPIEVLEEEKAAQALLVEKNETSEAKVAAAELPPIQDASETAAKDATFDQFVVLEALKSPSLAFVDWQKWPRDGFPEKSCDAFAKEKWKLNWFAEAYISPDYAARSLRAIAPEFTDYALMRDESEISKGAFTAGMRIAAITDFGLSLRTGMQYTQINEDFQYRDPNDIRITITQIINGLGEIIGTDTLYEYGTRVLTTHNRYRSIDIPITAGYEFKVHPRFSVALHGGVAFNLLFEQKGEILTPEGAPASISSDLPGAYPAFRSQTGMSVLGSIGLNYRVNHDTYFILEPQFRAVINPVTRPDYPVRQEYFMAGVSLGVRQKL